MRMTGAQRATVKRWAASGLIRVVQLPGCPVRYLEQDVVDLIEDCGTRRSTKSESTTNPPGGVAGSGGADRPPCSARSKRHPSTPRQPQEA
jgi:hypothetical protein